MLELHENTTALKAHNDDGLTLEQALNEFRLLKEAGMAENTRRTYESEIKTYAQWCLAKGYQAFPFEEEVVAAYVTKMVKEQRKPNGIKTALTALRVVNKLHYPEHPDPVTKDIQLALRGYQKKHPRKTQTKRAKPLRWEDVLMLIHACDDSLEGKRNKAIFATLYMNALRVAECASIDRRDLRPIDHWHTGYILDIPIHKTVQKAGAGQTQTATKGEWGTECPVYLLRDWMEASDAAWEETEKVWAKKISRELKKASEEAVAAKYREVLETRAKRTECTDSLQTRVQRALNEGASAMSYAELILEVERQSLFYGVKHGRITGRRLDARSIDRLLKRMAEKLVLDGYWEPDTIKALSTHSFRRGIATDAIENETPIWEISLHLRHQSEKTTRAYIDQRAIFTGGLGRALG